MHTTLTAENQPDFSMMLGGPLYQLCRRLHVLREPLDLVSRRIIVISTIAWLPLLLLAIVAGRAWGGVRVPFLYDIDAYTRFLVSLPLLVLAEWIVHIRFRPLVSQFLEREIIREQDRPLFAGIIDSSMRLRNSVAVEIALLALVFSVGPVSWRHHAALNASTWYADVVGSTFYLTLPGRYFVYVALPIFQFILLRWFFRLILWYRFLWKVSRLELNLMPTHPDGAGGLGFLTGSAHALAPLLVAQSVLLAGQIANRIFYAGAKLVEFKMEILLFVLFLLLQALAPLVFFAPALAACQRRGNREYGVLASRYTADFHRKWISDNGGSEEILGSGDIQSLADLSNSFAVIRSMSIIPFTKTTVLRLAIIAIIPILPLTLTVIPLDQMIDQLLKALL